MYMSSYPLPLIAITYDALQALQDIQYPKTHKRYTSALRRASLVSSQHLHELSERVVSGRFYHHLRRGSTLQLRETPYNWNDVVSERGCLGRRHPFQ